MTSVSLTQSTQSLVNTALTQGPGVNNTNYVAAYAAIYNDIANSNINQGTINWFSLAGAVDGQQYTPTASGAYIWKYTQAAAASQGYTITTDDLQTASNRIALSVFQTLQEQGYVLSDESGAGGFSPQQIIQDDAGAGIGYLQTQYPGVDFAIWGGTLFAQTALQDPTYVQVYNLNLTPGSIQFPNLLPA